MRKALMIGLTVGVLALLTLQSTFAVFGRNTFHQDAYLDTHGRHVWVTAQIACTEGERLSIDVMLTQDSTNAIGYGKAQTFCDDVDFDDQDAFQEVPVRVVARGRATFEPGHVVATGFASTIDRGRVTDTTQWQPADGLTIH
jgi:hypothetical protein